MTLTFSSIDVDTLSFIPPSISLSSLLCFSDSHACLSCSTSYIYFHSILNHHHHPSIFFRLIARGTFHSLYLYTFTIQTFFIRSLYFDSSFAIAFACIFIERTTLYYYYYYYYYYHQDLLFQCSSLRISGRSAALIPSDQRLGFSQTITDSMSNVSCQSSEREICRDESAALKLKPIAIASILVAGVAGIAIPLIGKQRMFLRTDGSLFVATKAFAAGVILATGFVHMLADGNEALTDPCLPQHPWSKFPFSGFFAMVASLLTLLVDFVGTQYYERKQGLGRGSTGESGRVESVESDSEFGAVPVLEGRDLHAKVFGAEEGGGMHIVGMHAHAAHHRHSHPHGQDGCDWLLRSRGHEEGHQQGHSHGHGHDFGVEDGDNGRRHVVVSQILELGIVSHSVIIGLSLGVSQSPCTVRPLIAALSFHQFFEGFALGGCISQAQFKTMSAAIMACFFAITTPVGIVIGTAIASSYNPYSPAGLLTEGILDSLSAGILVYMALVDLIAADFLSKTMSCNFRLQLVSYLMLFLGAGLMSSLAIWA